MIRCDVHDLEEPCHVCDRESVVILSKQLFEQEAKITAALDLCWKHWDHDPEHTITLHASQLPDYYRSLVKAMDQIRDILEPQEDIG